jgi:hypothetical protein
MKRPSKGRTSAKAPTGRDVAALEDIPSVGPALSADLRRVGISSPADLLGRDPYVPYEDWFEKTGKRHDPSLLDTSIATVRFMAGEPKEPWWEYTAERKRRLAARKPPGDLDWRG